MNPQKGGVRGGSYPKAPPCTAPLKPVLCSVPGDLQQEVLYLKNKVFPQLNALCQARGTCFTPVDVQWDNDQANRRSYDPAIHRPPLSSQQLKVSLDIITHSSSFICLLGHKYGPSKLEDSPPLPDPGPAREVLSGLDRNLCVAAEGGYPWILTGKNPTSSVTELQVTQAALMGDQRRCFFYFRDYSVLGEMYEEKDERDEHRRSLLSAFSEKREHERCRVRALKNSIVASLHPVRFFQTPEELGVLVMRDWKGPIEQLCGALLDQSPALGHRDSFERYYQEGFIHYLCHWFVPSSQTTAVLEALNTFTHGLTRDTSQSDRLLPRKSALQTTTHPNSWDSERSMVLLCGERGCGKTSLVAWWIQELRKTHPGIPVIPYFCGISNSSVDIGSVLRQFTVALHQACYGKQKGSQPEWNEGLSDRVRPRPLHVVVQAFVAAAALRPCILVLDGLDRLTGTLGLSMQEVKELSWLPSPLPPQCKLVLTTTSTDLTYKSLTLRPDVHTLTCPGLSDPGARRRLLLHHLTLPSLAPPGPLLQDLLRGRLGCLPLYLALVAGELQTCGVLRGAREVEGLMEGYTEVDSVAELWVRVVQRWSRDYGDGVYEGTPSMAEQTKPLVLVSETELRGWVWDSLCLVHLSRSGLTEGQIWALLEVLGHKVPEPLEWARFRSATMLWIQEKPSGALSFTHQSLTQAMDLLLMKIPPRRGPGGSTRTRRAYQLTLAQYFQGQSRETGSWGKVLEEVPWLLEQREAWGQLHTFLTDPETVEQLSSSWSQCPQLRIDIARSWTILTLKGYDPCTSYQRLLGNEVRGPPSGLIDLWGPSPGTCTDAVWVCESPVRARVAVFVSELLLCLSREQQAECLLLQALDTLTQAGEEDTERAGLLLDVQHTLAELCVATGRAGKAVTHFTSALRTAQTIATGCSQEPEGQLVRIGQLLCTLCQLMFAEGCVEEASRILSDIISLGHHMVHPCAKATVSMLQASHRISLDHRNACEAESLLQAALEIRRSWYGGEHPLVVEVEERLADVWAASYNTGLKRTEAVRLYRHAVRVRGQEMRPPRPLDAPLGQAKGCSLALTLIKLGRMLGQSSSKTERSEAEDLFQTALDLSLRSLGHEHTLTKDIQQIWTGAFRQTVASCDPMSRPPSHRRLSGSRPFTASTVSHRGASHTPLAPSRTRAQSGWSVTQSNQDPESVKNQNQRAGLSQLAPWSAVQTTVFGPKSDISNLTPRPKTAPSSSSRSADRTRVPQRAGWCHLPGRYLLEDQMVTALSTQIGPPVLRHRYAPMLRKTDCGPTPLRVTEDKRPNQFIFGGKFSF
ncbi:tetratricopeptide repeat protein 41 [Osmerus eperlanus]|uniref:tetratricopeptide repeat protein 41 n=1 Tax=Osmerus eperlanus TaxID=29151 RepID=UPI002E11C8FF